MVVGNGTMIEAGDPVKLSPIRTTNIGPSRDSGGRRHQLGAGKERGVSRDVGEKQITLVDPVVVAPVR